MNTHPHVDLIDTTEMYLRTIYELEEEGIVPLRARIAERLGQSGPTVSQTVARMERDGLLQVESDRHLALSGDGRTQAVSVMRKHRLAERLLADIIGLEWDQIHIEACRWEHVMSEAVERRILSMLKGPLVCPHGNPIPGLQQLGVALPSTDRHEDLLPTLSAAITGAGISVLIVRISEHLQADNTVLRELSDAGMVPGETVTLSKVAGGVTIVGGRSPQLFTPSVTDGIFVSIPAHRTATASVAS